MYKMVMRRALLATLLSGLAFASLAEPDVEALVRKALADEFLLMSRPMSEFERQFMSSKKRSDTMAAGLPEDTFMKDLMKDVGGVPIEWLRAIGSLELLNNATNLCEHERKKERRNILVDLAGRAGLKGTKGREEELCKIANERAVTRGDQMMVLGFDKTVGLFYRESLMRHAIEYYHIGEAAQKQRYAENERSILGQEVERAQAEQKARMEEMLQEMQPMIENMQRAGQDMLKSDAEKRAFEEEADALEAELGF